MTPLTEFLLARIADDKALIRRCHSPDVFAESLSDPWATRRLLAECEAKRRVVVEIAGPPPYRPDDYIDPTPLVILRLLAVPYADHPDYRYEWSPRGFRDLGDDA